MQKSKIKSQNFGIWLLAIGICLGFGILGLGFTTLVVGCGEGIPEEATTTTIATTTTTIPDTTAPTISSVFPVNGSTEVSLSLEVSATFSETMDASTVTASTFTLASFLGAVSGSATYDASSKTATFRPNSLLANLITYTATVTAGVKDLGGNNMASDYSWNFTTRAYSASLLYQKDGAAAGDNLGYRSSVASAVDVNGDGKADFIIGAPSADPSGNSNAGSAYVYSGADGTLLYQKDGAAASDLFGTSVASAGDVNGDGKADFIIGAPSADPSGMSGAGSAYVYISQ